MKKFLKPQLIFALVVVVMIFGIGAALSTKVPAVASTSCGQVLVKASGWLGGHGIAVRSNGADMRTKYACDPDGEVYNLKANPPQYGFGWVSVELINRLYVTKGWSVRLTIPTTYNGQKTYGGAKWLYTLAAASYYPNLAAHVNGSNYKPVPGDMIVHNNGTLGHVTVVDHISGSTLYAVDQNRSATGWERYAYNSSTGAVSMSGVTISGYVHSTLNHQVVHVSGTLPANITWTSDNIYVVDSQLTIPNGITLTINPGTIVKYQNASVGIDANIDVTLGGTLNATGTSTSSIIFTSLKDDSAGGDTNGDGSASSPAAGDYVTAIAPDGGTVTVSHANFSYGASDIGWNSSGINTGSHLTVTDSAFTNSDIGVNQWNDTSISLQRNSFALAAAGANNWAISTNESDLSGIVLSGTNKNTFSGSGPNVVVAVQGTVPSGSTWSIDSGPVLLVSSVTVTGTININAGVPVKIYTGTGFDVQSGGTLKASGTSTSPITFTSYKDDSSGGDTNGDGSSSSPAAGDYVTAIAPNGGTVNVTHATFKYASTVVHGYEGSSTTTITDSSFEHSLQGIFFGDAGTSETLTLQRNAFNLGGTDSWDLAMSLINVTDLSGISLSGTNKNTFSGSVPAKTVEVSSSSVPSGANWTIDSSSGAILQGADFTVDGTLTMNSNTMLLATAFYAVNVNGTVNLGSGVIVKSEYIQAAFHVNGGGTLDATGTSTSPVVFTSYKDDSVGGDTNGDGSASSPAAADYATAISMNGGSVNAQYSNFLYGDGGVASEETTGSGLTVTNGTFNHVDYAVYLRSDTKANLESVSVSNAEYGIEATDSSTAIFRGTFNNITAKSIAACNWGQSNGCTVDAAYVNWGSVDGPLASNPANNMVCGAVTVSPWVYGSSTYTMADNPNVYAVRNCDNSDTPSDQLASAVSNFQSHINLKEIDCGDGFADACAAIQTAYACISGAVDTAASTSPWPLPPASTADEVNAFGGQFGAAAATWLSSQEESAVASGYPIASDIISLTGTFLTMANAYNSCAP